MDNIVEILKKLKEAELGIDLDFEEGERNKEFKKFKTYFNIKSLFPDAKIKIYKSASENGYHFIVKSEELKDYTPEKKWLIREQLGDCEGRLEFSKRRGYDDVLFDWKIINGKWKKRREISENTLIGYS